MGFFDLTGKQQRKAFTEMIDKYDDKKVTPKVKKKKKEKVTKLTEKVNTGYGGKTGMTEAPGSNTGGMQTNLNKSMLKTAKNSIKKKKPLDMKKGLSVYKPTDMSDSMFGRSKLNRGSGNEVPGNRAVKDKAPVPDLMYGYANQGNKGNSVSNVKKPDYKKAVKADTKRKRRRELGRRTHDAAKKLMGG